jgi:hypothetical protein
LAACGRESVQTLATLRGFLDDYGLEAIGNHGFIPNTWFGPNSPGGTMSPTDELRLRTELEFAAILGMPYMGTGGDPTSANNRNIEPWTIACEKWMALNQIGVNEFGVQMYTHNHDPAYNFLQDGPTVTVTQDRLTGAAIPPTQVPFGDSRSDIDFATFFKNQGAKGYHNPNYEQDNAPGGGADPGRSLRFSKISATNMNNLRG